MQLDDDDDDDDAGQFADKPTRVLSSRGLDNSLTCGSKDLFVKLLDPT